LESESVSLAVGSRTVSQRNFSAFAAFVDANGVHERSVTMKVQIYYDSKNPEKPYRAVTTKVGRSRIVTDGYATPEEARKSANRGDERFTCAAPIRPKTFLSRDQG
jgi:hypothetical protein